MPSTVAIKNRPTEITIQTRPTTLTLRTGVRTVAGGASTALGKAITVDAMSFTVDPDDATAVDPASTDKFQSQAEITAFLALNNTTVFKHLGPVCQALPYIMAHDLTVTMAATVHNSPDSSTSAWDMGEKIVLPGVSIAFNGGVASTYTEIVASATVSSVDNTGENPRATVAGTPYAGLDLKGKLATFDTGQTTVIHSHTDSILSVMAEITGAPVSVVIGRPSTIVRNSADDIAKAGGEGINLAWVTFDSFPRPIQFNDIQIDAFGGHAISASRTGVVAEFNRVIMDHEFQRATFSISPNGRDIQVNAAGCALTFIECSGYADSANMGGRDEPVYVDKGSAVSLQYCYFGNSVKSVIATGAGTLFSIIRTVLDNLSTGKTVSLVDRAQINVSEFTSIRGKRNEIRNSVIGLEYGSGCGQSRDNFQALILASCSGACVTLARNSDVDICESANAWIDGGGNLDVGVDLIGVRNGLIFKTGIDVSGALGELRIDGAAPVAFASIVIGTPTVSTNLQTVERVA